MRMKGISKYVIRDMEWCKMFIIGKWPERIRYQYRIKLILINKQQRSGSLMTAAFFV
jgi:hypothetical protein